MNSVSVIIISSFQRFISVAIFVRTRIISDLQHYRRGERERELGIDVRRERTEGEGSEHS